MQIWQIIRGNGNPPELIAAETPRDALDKAAQCRGWNNWGSMCEDNREEIYWSVIGNRIYI